MNEKSKSGVVDPFLKPSDTGLPRQVENSPEALIMHTKCARVPPYTMDSSSNVNRSLKPPVTKKKKSFETFLGNIGTTSEDHRLDEVQAKIQSDVDVLKNNAFANQANVNRIQLTLNG